VIEEIEVILQDLTNSEGHISPTLEAALPLVAEVEAMLNQGVVE